MNSGQRRKAKRLWRNFLKHIAKPLINFYSTERIQELSDIWKEFTGEIPVDKTRRWKTTGQ